MRLWILALFALLLGCLGVAGVTPSSFAAIAQGEAAAPPAEVSPSGEDTGL